MNDKTKPEWTPNHSENVRSFSKAEDIKLPIIIHREGCWFFDRKCLYPKSDVEIKIEIHNEELTLGDFITYNSVFGTPYTLEAIYTIPTPDEPWCERCMEAMEMREDYDLGHGRPRRKEVNDKK